MNRFLDYQDIVIKRKTDRVSPNTKLRLLGLMALCFVSGMAIGIYFAQKFGVGFLLK